MAVIGEKRVRVTNSSWSSLWRQRQRSLPCSRSHTSALTQAGDERELAELARSALSVPWLARWIRWLEVSVVRTPSASGKYR